MRHDYVIGIDPDTEKNGYAIVDVADKTIHAGTATLPDLLSLVTIRDGGAKAVGKSLKVVVEAGWLNHSNWHLDWRDNKQVAVRKGKDMGRNQQRGMDIVELLRWKGVDVEEVAPLEKRWKGKDRKITHDELVRVVGKIEHTNQEGRDAALLAWVHAGLPVKV